MNIPREEYQYVQDVLSNKDMPPWRKAELIDKFDREKYEAQARGSDRGYLGWVPCDRKKLEAEIKELENGAA